MPFTNQTNKVIDIGKYVKKGNNKIKVIVSTPVATNGDGKKLGLFGVNGKVQITPYKIIKLTENNNSKPNLPLIIGLSAAGGGLVIIASSIILVFALKRRRK